MGLSRTVSEINGEFANFPALPGVYLTPLLKGFLLEFGSGAWRQKKTRMMGYRTDKEIWRHLQPSGYNARTDRQTDGHRTTAKTVHAYA